MFLLLFLLLVPVFPIFGQTSDPPKSSGLQSTITSIGLSNFKDIDIFQNKVYIADGKNGISIYVIDELGSLIPFRHVPGNLTSDISGIAVDENIVVTFDSSNRQLGIYDHETLSIISTISIGSTISNLRGVAIVQSFILAFGNGIGIFDPTNLGMVFSDKTLNVYDFVEVNGTLFFLTNQGLLEFNANSPESLEIIEDEMKFQFGDHLLSNGSNLLIFSQERIFQLMGGTLPQVGTYSYEINQLFAFGKFNYLLTDSGLFLLNVDYSVGEKQPLWGIDLIRELLFHGGFAFVVQGVMGINRYRVANSGELVFVDYVDLPSNNVLLVDFSQSEIFTVLISEYDRIRVFFDLEEKIVDFPFRYEILDIDVAYPYIYLLNSTHFTILEFQEGGSLQVIFTSNSYSGSSISLSGDRVAIAGLQSIQLLDVSSPHSPHLLDTANITNTMIVKLVENTLFYATNSTIGQLEILSTRFTDNPQTISIPKMGTINDLVVTDNNILLTGTPYIIIQATLPISETSAVQPLLDFDAGISIIPLQNETIILVTATQISLLYSKTLDVISNFSQPLISYDAVYLPLEEIPAIITANGDEGYSILRFPSPIDSDISPFSIISLLFLAIPVLIILIGGYRAWKFLSRKRRHQSPALENDYLDR